MFSSLFPVVGCKWEQTRSTSAHSLCFSNEYIIICIVSRKNYLGSRGWKKNELLNAPSLLRQGCLHLKVKNRKIWTKNDRCNLLLAICFFITVDAKSTHWNLRAPFAKSQNANQACQSIWPVNWQGNSKPSNSRVHRLDFRTTLTRGIGKTTDIEGDKRSYKISVW